MASPSKLLTFLLFTTLFIISTHARDSHFFSKVTRHPDSTTTTTTTTTTNSATTTNENDEFSPLNKQNEEEIDHSFITETSTEPGFAQAYDHETGLFPPSAAATTSTTTSTTDNNNNNVFENLDQYFPEKYVAENKNYINNENYKNNDKSYYYDGREYKRNGEEGVGNYGGVQKQGMSDTRLSENGMYFYDVNAEKTNSNNDNDVDKGGNYNNYGANNNMSYTTNYGGNYKENEYYGGNNNEFYNRNVNFDGDLW